MNPTLQIIVDILAMLFRFVGVLAFGFGAGWFALDAYRKGPWQLQIAALLGLLGTAIGLADFTSAGALGAFGLGAGGAILTFGIPKKKDATTDEAKKK